MIKPIKEVKQGRRKIYVCPYTDIQCDSKEEVYFIWWMIDLKKSGYIKSFRRASSQSLSEAEYYRQKTNTTDKLKSLLQAHEYTPDYVIMWEHKAEHLFYCYHNKVTINGCPFIICFDFPCSVVEIKGTLNSRIDKGGSVAKFQVNRKWLFQKSNIYVELVEIKQLFTQTFTPKRYTYTDKATRMRKVDWKIKTVDEYVKIRENLKNG